MPKKPRAPFELRLSPEQREDLALELSRALDDAQSARSAKEIEVQYWHTLYEQGRTRSKQPWADAADLTSYLGTQYVDVLRSMIVGTVFSDQVYTVEGYGAAEKNAPFVEEFHQWQLEAEGFQQVFARAAHNALIEPRGVIEVYEDTIKRPVRKVIDAALQLAPDGSAMVGEDLKPMLQSDPQGKFIEAPPPDPTNPLAPQVPSAKVEVDSYETVCRGPRERTIAYRDFLVLPGHAREKSEIWGYAKRFYRRLDELKERAEAGQYDAKAVEDLGTDDERPSATTPAGEPIGVAAKDGSDLVEKELWEVLILRDLDGKGPRWFVATVHKDKQKLLRIQYDDIGRPRYFSLVPFPRPDSTEGYSYIGHKLITVIEEHTAVRNMRADREAMALQMPIKRKVGALWDPDAEPLGPKAIITVREMTEVEPMEYQANTAGAVEWLAEIERAGERLSGINDASAGVTSENQRTLGEVELITQQSMGRTSEAVKNIQETLEEIAQVRHIMWKRALADMGDEGMEMPPSVLQGLELRGVNVLNYTPNLKFTAQMLEGAFRFKPKGSVESADRRAQRFDYNQFLLAVSSLMKVNPMISAILATPNAAKALLEQAVRLYNVQDKQAFLGQDALMQAQQMMLMQQQAAMMGAAGPGAPPGGGPPSAGGPPRPSAPPGPPQPRQMVPPAA